MTKIDNTFKDIKKSQQYYQIRNLKCGKSFDVHFIICMFLIVIVILLLDFHHVSSLSIQFEMMICQKDDLNDDEYVLVCAYMY